MDPNQQPPPYSAGPSTTTSYPTKTGGPPMQGGTAMQPGYPTNPGYPATPGYPVNPGYVATNPGNPPNANLGVATTTTTTRTIVQQQPPAVILNTGFGEVPVSMQCPNCRTQIVTATEFAPGSLAWLACCGLAAVGCVLGCCFIPFCIDEMKDVTHTCPNCKTVVGIYRRL